MVGDRHMPYKCPAGKLTIGYGRNIEDNGITNGIAGQMLMLDLIEAKNLLIDNVPCFERLNEVRQSVLIDMSFNMGWPTLSKFKKMLAALEVGDYEEAGAQMEDSAWYRQVGGRAIVLVAMMESGDYPG